MLETHEVADALARIPFLGQDSENPKYDVPAYWKAIEAVELEWVKGLRYWHSDSLPLEAAKRIFKQAQKDTQGGSFEDIEERYMELASMVEAVISEVQAAEVKAESSW